MAKRIGPDELVRISPDSSKRIQSDDFRAMDGFSATDIYACGGRGNLWHFDGSQWSQLDPSANWGMRTICCAEDGQIYIQCHSVLFMIHINF